MKGENILKPIFAIFDKIFTENFNTKIYKGETDLKPKVCQVNVSLKKIPGFQY